MISPGQLAFAAYKAPGEFDIYLNSLGVRGVAYQFYDHGSTQAYLLKGNLRQYPVWLMAIRGTEPTRIEDILVDLHAHPFRYPWYAPGSVHHGFGDEAESLFQWLKRKLPIDNEWPLVLCGHSLGAGVATLLAARVFMERRQPPSAYLYGAPRVGNATFAATFNKHLFVHTQRVVHNNDWVPRVPPVWIGYRHVGRELYANQHARIVKLGMFALLWDKFSSRVRHWGERGLDALQDHAMDHYLAIEAANPGFFPDFEI